MKKSYLYTWLFTGVILCIIIAKLQLYPFGNHSFQYMDGDQYWSYYGYLMNTFFSKSNLLYSWSMVLGHCFLSTYAYYAASPLNFLLVFFKDNLPLGVQLLTFLKFFLITTSFCAMLNYEREGYDLEKGILSTSYGFIGYIVYYAWNLSWFDGVALLPLIYVGLKKMIDKKEIKLYIIVLTLSIISNFYIGYMICIASFLIYMMICSELITSNNWKFIYKKTFPLYIKSSLVAVGLSMPLLLPAILGVPISRNESFSNMIKNCKFNFHFIDFLSMFYTGAMKLEKSSDNLPNIYVGIIPLLLFFIFLLNRKIELRKKIRLILPLVILFFSFQVSIVNVVWHGFAINNWFNYRYSFIFSFFMLLIAFDALIKLHSNVKLVLIAESLFLLITAAAYIIYSYRFSQVNLKLDLIMSMVITFLLIIYNSKLHKLSLALLSISVIFTLSYSSIITIQDGTNNTDIIDSLEQKNTVGEFKNIAGQNIEMIRMVNDTSGNRCEPSMYNYAGITNYASTENINTLYKVQDYGLSQRWMWAYHTEHVPQSTDNMLGIKYLLSKKKSINNYNFVKKIGEYYLYENEEAFPFLFEVDKLCERNGENYFEMQNDLYQSLHHSISITDILYTKQDYIISKENSNKKYLITVPIEEGSDNLLYMKLSLGDSGEITVNDGMNKKTIQYSNENNIYNLGKFESSNIEIEISSDTSFDISSLLLYRLDQEVLSKYSRDVVFNNNFNFKQITSSNLRLKTDNSEKMILSSSIPYDESWRVFVDGKPIHKLKNADMFLAFEVDGGVHTIRLMYIPSDLLCGSLIFAYSLFKLVEMIKNERIGKGSLS